MLQMARPVRPRTPVAVGLLHVLAFLLVGAALLPLVEATAWRSFPSLQSDSGRIMPATVGSSAVMLSSQGGQADVLLWGGSADASVYAFKSSSQRWQAIRSEPGPAPVARHSHCGVAVPGVGGSVGGSSSRMVILFGTSWARAQEQSDAWAFEPRNGSTGVWSRVDFGGSSPAPSPRSMAACVARDNLVYVHGGARLLVGGDITLLSDLWVLDVEKGTWRRPELAAASASMPYAPPALAGHGAALLPSLPAILFYGGVNTQTRTSLTGLAVGTTVDITSGLRLLMLPHAQQLPGGNATSANATSANATSGNSSAADVPSGPVRWMPLRVSGVAPDRAFFGTGALLGGTGFCLFGGADALSTSGSERPTSDLLCLDLRPLLAWADGSPETSGDVDASGSGSDSNSGESDDGPPPGLIGRVLQLGRSASAGDVFEGTGTRGAAQQRQRRQQAGIQTPWPVPHMPSPSAAATPSPLAPPPLRWRRLSGSAAEGGPSSRTRAAVAAAPASPSLFNAATQSDAATAAQTTGGESTRRLAAHSANSASSASYAAYSSLLVVGGWSRSQVVGDTWQVSVPPLDAPGLWVDVPAPDETSLFLLTSFVLFGAAIATFALACAMLVMKRVLVRAMRDGDGTGGDAAGAAGAAAGGSAVRPDGTFAGARRAAGGAGGVPASIIEALPTVVFEGLPVKKQPAPGKAAQGCGEGEGAKEADSDTAAGTGSEGDEPLGSGRVAVASLSSTASASAATASAASVKPKLVVAVDSGGDSNSARHSSQTPGGWCSPSPKLDASTGSDGSSTATAASVPAAAAAAPLSGAGVGATPSAAADASAGTPTASARSARRREAAAAASSAASPRSPRSPRQAAAASAITTAATSSSSSSSTAVAPRGRPAATSFDAEAQSTCAICLQDFVAGERLRVLPCLHRFHCECGDTWLKDSRRCPLCKDDVLAAAGLPLPVPLPLAGPGAPMLTGAPRAAAARVV